MTDWQPDLLRYEQLLTTAGTTVYLYLLFRVRNPLSITDELFSFLQPIFFWLANILEFYNYLISRQPSLGLTLPSTGDSQETDDTTDTTQQMKVDDENPLVTLKNVMEYSFQQAFYPISKVCINVQCIHCLSIHSIRCTILCYCHWLHNCFFLPILM